MADTNKVRFGFSNVHFAFVAEDSAPGALKYDTPIAQKGAVDFSPDAAGSEYTFYADNQKYYVSYGDTGYTGDLETAKFEDELLAAMFGWEEDDNGGLLEVANAIKRDFALLGQVEGDKQARRFVFYSCTGGKPSQVFHTNEDGIEVQTETMPVTCSTVDIGGGKQVTRYAITRTDTNKDIYDNFFDDVYMPWQTTPAV